MKDEIDISQNNIINKIEKYLKINKNNVMPKTSYEVLEDKSTHNILKDKYGNIEEIIKSIKDGFCYGAASSWLLSCAQGKEKTSFIEDLKNIANWDEKKESIATKKFLQISKNKLYKDKIITVYDDARNKIVASMRRVISQFIYLQAESNIKYFHKKTKSLQKLNNQEFHHLFEYIKNEKIGKKEFLDKQFQFTFPFDKKSFSLVLDHIRSKAKNNVLILAETEDHAIGIYVNKNKLQIYDPNNKKIIDIDNSEDLNFTCEQLFSNDLNFENISFYKYSKNIKPQLEDNLYPKIDNLISSIRIMGENHENKNLNLKNKNGKTPLYLASIHNSIKTVRALLSLKAKLSIICENEIKINNKKIKLSLTPLEYSIIFGKQKISDLILTEAKNRTEIIKNYLKELTKTKVIFYKDLEMLAKHLQYFHKKSRSLNTEELDILGNKILARHAEFPYIKDLTNAFITFCNAKFLRTRRALHLAILDQDYDLIKSILKFNNTNHDIINKSYQINEDLIEKLSVYGSDEYLEMCNTPLSLAINMGDYNIVKILLNHKNLKINQKFGKKNFKLKPLIHALKLYYDHRNDDERKDQYYQIIKIMLNHYDIRVRLEAIRFAVYTNNLEIVKLVCEKRKKLTKFDNLDLSNHQKKYIELKKEGEYSVFSGLNINQKEIDILDYLINHNKNIKRNKRKFSENKKVDKTKLDITPPKKRSKYRLNISKNI